jgi:hypothetical protein
MTGGAAAAAQSRQDRLPGEDEKMIGMVVPQPADACARRNVPSPDPQEVRLSVQACCV